MTKEEAQHRKEKGNSFSTNSFIKNKKSEGIIFFIKEKINELNFLNKKKKKEEIPISHQANALTPTWTEIEYAQEKSRLS